MQNSHGERNHGAFTSQGVKLKRRSGLSVLSWKPQKGIWCILCARVGTEQRRVFVFVYVSF